MSTETANLGLTKPELDEQYQLSVWNGNSDILDQFAGEVNAALAAGSAAREKTDAALTGQINGGAKNRLKVTATSRTHNGITFTVNADGTVTANGTATANAYTILATVPSTSELFDGTYFLSGCPTGGIYTETYALYAALGSYTRYDLGEGVTLTSPGSTGNVSFVAIVYAGYTADNLIFRPMVCKTADYQISSEYEPYCPTMPDLYQMILALQNGG